MFKLWVHQRLSVLRKAHEQMLGRDVNRLKITTAIITTLLSNVKRKKKVKIASTGNSKISHKEIILKFMSSCE